MLFDFSERLDLALILLDRWSLSPLTIIFGLGNSASFSPSIIGVYPHVVPLEVLGEEGLIGFFLFALVLFLTFSQVKIAALPGALTQSQRKVYAANLACFVFSLFLAFKQGSLLGSYAIFLFAALGEKYLILCARERRQAVVRTPPIQSLASKTITQHT